MQASTDPPPVWAIGTMTGTALDGVIDVALLKTDGSQIIELGPWLLSEHGAKLRPLLLETVEAARQWQFNGKEPEIFRIAEEAITRAHAEAVRQLLNESGFKADDIAVLGFHGQTVLHRAPSGTHLGNTRQLGDGRLLAELTGIKVAFDFRTADIRAGGQGAPLSPVYHVALLKHLKIRPPAAVLNLGGVANLTGWGGADEFVAFDTGPANGPINDWIERHGLGIMDVDGALAASGKVDRELLARLLQHPYFSAEYPKSLDRFDFSDAMVRGLNVADGAATLAAFAAAGVKAAIDVLPQRPSILILCGGGRNNLALVRAIRDAARDVDVRLAEELGVRGDAVEAECFGFLAVRVLYDLPLSFPLTTGVAKPTRGGVLAIPQ